MYAVIYIVATTIIYFPWTLYTQFFREHRYDLATQTFGEWFRDRLVGLARPLPGLRSHRHSAPGGGLGSW